MKAFVKQWWWAILIAIVVFGALIAIGNDAVNLPGAGGGQGS